MNLRLDGRRVLVTGSSAGIGKSIALMLAEEGARVVVHGRNEERAVAVVAEIEDRGGQAAAVLGDVSDDDAVRDVAAEATAAFDGIDILVNNAGDYPWQGWWEGDAGLWRQVYNEDVVAFMQFVQALVPSMADRGWGRVICISSCVAQLIPRNMAPHYAAAKAALTQATRSLASELTGTGVTANIVSPGPVGTDRLLDVYRPLAEADGEDGGEESTNRWVMTNVLADAPVRRMVKPEEIAAAVALLSSPLSDATTGTDYAIDSGYALAGYRRLSPYLAPEQRASQN
jgi:3-oxoacyl-[acyl-carrier protein] reductase